ncbi:MAG: hypothetical protein AAF658_15975 [Myxococcota bacterium]
MHKGLLYAAETGMGEERDKKASGLMGMLLEEIAEQAGTKTGPTAVEISHGDDSIVLSATGWPLLEASAAEPPDDNALRRALALLGQWAREEADELIDVCMDTPLEQRERLVEHVIHRVGNLGPEARLDAVSLLQFLDEGLALEGEAVELSIRIQTALIEDLSDS